MTTAISDAGLQLFDGSIITSAKDIPHFNDIVNGNFVIAQMGTSFAAPAAGAYDVDGWLNGNTSTAVFTVAQVAGSTAGRLARQATITTAKATVVAGDLITDEVRIEGYNIEKYVGNTFTIGFRARVPVAGIHCVALRNSGGDRSYVVEINFPVANVYQNCSFTVVGGLPTSGTWNYTNGAGLVIDFCHMVGTTYQTTPNAWNTGNFLGTANQVNDCATVGNAWALEKVTMNLGTVAAVSEISLEAETIRCQRYFEPAVPAFIRGTCASASGNLGQQIYFKTSKRVTPTIAPTGTVTVANVNTELTGGITTEGFQYQITVASANVDSYVSGRVYAVYARL